MSDEWKEIANKALDKVPVEKLYEDLLQPGLKKAGQALATIIDIGNAALFPFAVLNGRTALLLRDNLRRYEEKLNAVDAPVIQVPEAISVPILQKLAITTQKELSEAFINILTKASFEHTIHHVHPSFIYFIENISSDEARILSNYDQLSLIPTIRCTTKIKHGAHSAILTESNFTDFEDRVNLDFPENTSFYTENLHRLGLFEISYLQFVTGGDYYSRLELMYLEKLHSENHEIIDKTTFQRGIIRHTEIGTAFIRTCLKDIIREI